MTVDPFDDNEEKCLLEDMHEDLRDLLVLWTQSDADPLEMLQALTRMAWAVRIAIDYQGQSSEGSTIN